MPGKAKRNRRNITQKARVDNAVAPAPSPSTSPSMKVQTVKTQATPSATSTVSPFTSQSYVMGEIMRIGIVTAIVLAVLAVLYFFI